MNMTGTPPGNIIKEYPPRGPMRQFRFEKVIAFACFRCSQEKKSKLITIHNENWNKRLCNGCYGRLLSIYEIKANSQSEDEKVKGLSELLLQLVSDNDIRLTTERLRIKENRFNHLNELSIRFLASADHISSKLDDDYSLDWSPVVIGLCKSFENELVSKIIRPFKDYCKNISLEKDRDDKDIGRIAKFIDSEDAKEPELGTFGHFLQTALNSRQRRETSNLIKAFYDFLSNYPHSNWILDNSGLLRAIQTISKDYRNRAAHIDELTKIDFEECKTLLIGNDGALWKMNLALK